MRMLVRDAIISLTSGKCLPLPNKKMSTSEVQYVKAVCLKILSKLNLNNQRAKNSVIICKSFNQIFILGCRTVLRHI